MYKLNRNILLDDRSVFIKNIKTLIIADLHIGYAEDLHSKGIFLPDKFFKDLKNRLNLLIKKHNPQRVIFLGDIQHQYNNYSVKIKKKISDIFNIVLKNKSELILIRGNHEKAIKDNFFGHKLKDYAVINSYYFTHGDRVFPIPSKIKYVFMGHEHPAVKLHETSRTESFKAYLEVKTKTKIILVLPSFNDFSIGQNIIKEEFISPYLNKIDSNKINVYVNNNNRIIFFGSLKKLREIF